MTTRVTGTGVAGMRELAVKLRDADPKLRRALLRRFREVAAPVVQATQRSILDMPSVHGSKPGVVPLREAVARTVTSSVGLTRSGARLDIVSSGRKMPEGEDRMPKHLDSARGWGHPVFQRRGRPAVWVHQFGKPQWFEDPPAHSGRVVQGACSRAMNDVARDF